MSPMSPISPEGKKNRSWIDFLGAGGAEVVMVIILMSHVGQCGVYKSMSTDS